MIGQSGQLPYSSSHRQPLSNANGSFKIKKEFIHIV